MLLILSTIRRGDLFLNLLSPFDCGDLLLLLLLSPLDFGDLLLLLLLSPEVFGDLLLFFSLDRPDVGAGDKLERLLPFGAGAGERLLLSLDSLLFFCFVLVSLDLVVFEIFVDFEESTVICEGGLYDTLLLFGLFLVEIGGSNISGFGAPVGLITRRALTVGGVGGATRIFIEDLDL